MDEPKIQISDNDLERLLDQADREDRLLVAPPEEREAREDLDSQILAGLVSP